MVGQYLSENDMDDLPIFVANKLKEPTEQNLKHDVAYNYLLLTRSIILRFINTYSKKLRQTVHGNFGVIS